MEVLNQPWFFNQVGYFEAGDGDTPTSVLKQLKEIEVQLGESLLFVMAQG